MCIYIYIYVYIYTHICIYIGIGIQTARREEVVVDEASVHAEDSHHEEDVPVGGTQ